MVNETLFDELVDSIIDGLSKHHFGIGDGLECDSGGGDDESDGTYILRAFYYDDETDFEHTIKINVTVEVEEIRDTEDDDEDEE